MRFSKLVVAFIFAIVCSLCLCQGQNISDDDDIITTSSETVTFKNDTNDTVLVYEEGSFEFGSVSYSEEPQYSNSGQDFIDDVQTTVESMVETTDPPMEQIRHSTKFHATMEPLPDAKSERKTADEPFRPNIILIITDDQDIELGSMDYMPRTLKAFRDGGIEFRHGYVTTPMCCPSRSSLLTGLYVHNHNVFTNNDNCSSIYWREKHEKKTFASYLWSAGYYTSYIGKYLNKYDGSHIPHGWDEWNTLLMNSRYYNYTINRNGQKFRYGNKREDYYPDKIADDSLDFLSRMASRKKHEDPNIKNRPFLLVASFPSPHGPEDSAPEHSKKFFNVTDHHTLNYNHAPNLDKQWILRVTPEMTPVSKAFTDLLMTKRLQTLQSVDEAVDNMFKLLKDTKLIESTYVFYISDHGYHLGQYGLLKGKAMPYEFDIRVPFFATGPSSLLKKGVKALEPVLNIDIAPTFLELGGVTPPPEMDGRSFVSLLRKYSPSYDEAIEPYTPWEDVFLIESSGRRDGKHRGATSIKSPLPTGRNGGKKGDKRKNSSFFINNETMKINKLCLIHHYPCSPGQKKYCLTEKNRVQFRKCRKNIDYIDGYSSFTGENSGSRNSFNASDLGNTKNKCHCRSRRSTIDWEAEREKIDEEIIQLKERIYELRQKRRQIRRKQAVEGTSVYENFTMGTTQHETEHLLPPGEDEDEFEFDISEVESLEDEVAKHSDSSIIYSSESEMDDEDLEILSEDTDGIVDNYFHPPEIIKEVSAMSEDEDMPVRNNRRKNRKKFRNNRNWRKNKNRKRIPEENYELLTEDDENLNENGGDCECTNDTVQWLRKREKQDRKRKKMLSKLRKKQKFQTLFENPVERYQAENCGRGMKMNCFWHDNNHWKTEPLWTLGSFCFCLNANNNSYSCIRSINATHNYLYCQFVTGFKMYFDLKKDPYQLENGIGNLPAENEDWILSQLIRLKGCTGRANCWTDAPISTTKNARIQPNIWAQIFGKPRKKKNRKRMRNN